MKIFRVGDKIKLTDDSYSFGIYNRALSWGAERGSALTVVRTGMSVTRFPDDKLRGNDPYCKINDLLVTDGDGNFWFTQSRFCKSVDKKIELRYFVDGKDVTDKISDETKQGLKSINR